MENQELAHLVKMLNEIAANLAHGEEDSAVAVRVADHLRRFWAPAMRRRIIDYVRQDGSRLRTPCRIAVNQLAQEAAAADSPP